MGSAYHRLGRVAKMAGHLGRLRSDPVRCPACGNQVLERELVLEVHGLHCSAKWLMVAGVRQLEVSPHLLRLWTIRGKVRRRKRDGVWRYSAFDVHMAIIEREEHRSWRRKSRLRRAARSRWRR